MTAQAWITLAGIMLTAILFPLGKFLWSLDARLNKIATNDLHHIYGVLKLICHRLDIEIPEEFLQGDKDK